jgi:hypothetical protein
MSHHGGEAALVLRDVDGLVRFVLGGRERSIICRLQLLEVAERDLSVLPQRDQDLITGYVSGYNRYLAEHGPEGFPGWCAGAEQARPITPMDHDVHGRDGQ